MKAKASITVLGSRAEVQRLWSSSDHRPAYTDTRDAAVTFTDAPGDRGTEIRIDLDHAPPGGKLGEVAQKLMGAAPLAKVKDDLRRFKQSVETGEVTRSDGVPEGELAERKLKHRPAQPLDASELGKAGAR